MKRQATTTQFFYQGCKLVTVNQSGLRRAIFRSADLSFAELSTGEHQESGLLKVDQNGSVMMVSGGVDKEESHCYTAYGYDPSLPSHRTYSGFNGERLEAIAAAYLLGNGYRLYNPVLMRFHSTDSMSPFDRGGMNCYCYCLNDPVNNTDPSGHFLKRIYKPLRPREPAKYLKNHYPNLLKKELNLIDSNKARIGDQRKIVTDSRSLLNYAGQKVKFVIDKNQEMAIAKTEEKTSNNYVSHPALAKILNNQKIISAGTLIPGSLGDVIVINHSGHYRPSMQDLEPAMAKIRSMGLDPSAASFQ
jgi:RHS repeat-associated protein